MSLIKYKAVVQVAESKSLTKAAKVLGYSQPGISHMISSLEKELGLSLFHRNRDICTLTENGKELLYYFSQITKYEEHLQQNVHSLNGLLSGTIKIGALSSLLIDFVPKVIHSFSTTYSNIEIQLKEKTFGEINNELQNGLIDLGFTNDNIPNTFEFIPLLKDPVCLIIHPDHPFNQYEKIPIGILNGCDFIMPMHGFDDVIITITKKVKFRPNIKYQVASDIAVIGMVANNLGVSVVSKKQTHLHTNKIVAKEFCEDFHRTLGIAVRSTRHATPVLKTFIKVARSIAEK